MCNINESADLNEYTLWKRHSLHRCDLERMTVLNIIID